MRHKDPYTHIAPLYDLVVSPFLQKIRRDICELARDLQVHTVVDLGCGTGRQCALLNEYGFDIYGVDYSGAMLDQAKTKAPGATYFLADISSTHFLPESFDCAVLSLVLHEHPLKIRQQILNEALRIVRPEGHLFLLDHGRITRTGSSIIHCLLHLPERLAGQEHYRNYRSFMNQGGLQELVAIYSETSMVLEKGYYLDSLWLCLVKKQARVN